MKLSIIIPIYKVEKYIENCIISLLDQDLSQDDYELIFIDDGSPDNSKDIVKKHINMHLNMHLIVQKNKGVSSARNRGLDIAKGSYITFVDPDDAIYRNSLKKVLKKIIDDNLDILYLNIESVDEEGNFLKKIAPTEKEGIVKKGFEYPRRTLPATIYRNDIIKNIRFTDGITRGQDSIFNAMVQTNSQKCGYYDEPYYKYTERTSSSRQFIQLDRTFNSNLLALDTIIDFRNKQFPVRNEIQDKYFDEVIKLFTQRTLEWSILPKLNKKRLNSLKNKLYKRECQYIIPIVANDFKHFDKSATFYILFNKFYRFYKKVKLIK